jgi:hypothetical protein
MKTSCILILLLNLLSGTFVFAQNNLPYLGQDPPGMTAKRFPPDSLWVTATGGGMVHQYLRPMDWTCSGPNMSDTVLPLNWRRFST